MQKQEKHRHFSFSHTICCSCSALGLLIRIGNRKVMLGVEIDQTCYLIISFQVSTWKLHYHPHHPYTKIRYVYGKGVLKKKELIRIWDIPVLMWQIRYKSHREMQQLNKQAMSEQGAMNRMEHIEFQTKGFWII